PGVQVEFTPETRKPVIGHDDQRIVAADDLHRLSNQLVHFDVVLFDDFRISIALRRNATGMLRVLVAPEDMRNLVWSAEIEEETAGLELGECLAVLNDALVQNH